MKKIKIIAVLLVFSAFLASQGGADCYYEIYDAEGNDLIELDSWVN